MVQEINDHPNFQQRDNSVQVIKSEDKCGERLALPEFSSLVKTALCAGNSSEVWSQMIEELVTFYSRKYPDRMKCSDDYQNSWPIDVCSISINWTVWYTCMGR